ncbi:MAG: metallophosphoesterase, partial [Fervidobacterium sp.]
MKKFLSLIILFLALLYVFGETKQVVIIHTSDLHGFIYPVDYSTNKPANYGLARVSSFIKEQRERYGNENVVIIDTGDLIQGSPMAYYYARFDTEKEHPMIIAMNKLGFSASVFGNHEFNYGLDLIDKVMHEANFPFISANVTREEDGMPLGFPYTVVYSGDVRIGILGLTTKFVPNWEDPRNIKGIKFIDIPLMVSNIYPNN